MITKRAELLARFVHFNQKRQDNEPYINHCERVAHQVSLLESATEDMICAAWLHDCIEDADLIMEMNDFIFNVFGYDIWDIVITLTHDPVLGSYIDYIKRVSQHPQALQIKFLDMIDNTSYNIPPEQWGKYHRAIIFLREKGIEIPAILKERLL